MKALLRGWLATVLGSAVFMTAPLAFAEGEACFNDTDCPGTECGGEVCNWNKHHPTPVGDKAYVCNPAGTSPKGSDGWCTTVDHCKCKAQGAKCTTVYCSFTKASDAPMSTAGTGTGGSASTAGTSSTGGSAAGTAAGGTATKPPAAEEESSGCSVASPASTGGGIALALGLVGVGAAFARRRRS
jgi:MYXO-CTERM domain-containing protein